MVASMRGSVRVMEWLCERGDISPGALENAATSLDTFNLIRLLVRKCPNLLTSKVVRIAAADNVVVMRWLLNQMSEIDPQVAATLVATFGYEEVLAIQAESNRVAAIVAAAKAGELSMVQRLFNEFQGKHVDTQRIIREAAQNGRSEIIQWLRQCVDDDNYRWAFSPAVGCTRSRESDLPEAVEFLMGESRKQPRLE
ncbi:hypothetical protein PRNP1_004552 [Phytophthora ramorum]